ncbi:MAG: ADP-glyceromanno-heptose 6-epimerase [Chlamydiae bacterium]|nr:MAG: ADP-glyceromanno-heptose 6-epimerase [Chlamydiota bacterium]
MIVVTGGAGFIGSCFVQKLNQMGIDDILIVDHLRENDKWKNLVGKKFEDYIDKIDFPDLLADGCFDDTIDSVVHIGACSSTTETDTNYLMENNYRYTKFLAQTCLKNNIKFYYASSAATYGDGELGFSDEDVKTPDYRPLNMYGYSKHLFDLWVLKNELQDKLTGFKFFNVFGPNEYHKDSMRSLVHKALPDARDNCMIRLFKSYNPEYSDGGQTRDFVYVKDVLNVMAYFFEHPDIGGIYNIGTGKAQSWNELANAMFAALNVKGEIEYIDMPDQLKDKYQYFTKADLTKLRRAGCDYEFMTLKDSIADYIQNHLMKSNPYL